MLEEYLPFMWLIIFGNIENLILSSQGVVNGVNPKILGGLSIIVVIIWLVLGTVLTEAAIQYSNVISFIGGLAIFILGIQAVYGAIKNPDSGITGCRGSCESYHPWRLKHNRSYNMAPDWNIWNQNGHQICGLHRNHWWSGHYHFRFAIHA